MTTPSDPPVKRWPTVFFYLIGLPVVLGGIGLAALGVMDGITAVQQHDHPLLGDGPEALASAAIRFSWGAVVFTIGRYLWRAARRRGWKDRVGRLLVIFGYILVGFALQETVAGMLVLSHARTAEGMQAAVIETLISSALYGVPGALLAAVGMKMADEKALMTVSVEGRFST